MHAGAESCSTNSTVFSFGLGSNLQIHVQAGGSGELGGWPEEKCDCFTKIKEREEKERERE